MSKSNQIQLSDHFTTGRLLKFTASPIIMMIFTSIYTIVDGFFVSNCAGKTAFTALNNGTVSAAISFLRTLLFQVVSILTLPLIIGVDGIWLAVVAAEAMALVCTGGFVVRGRKRYGYL